MVVANSTPEVLGAAALVRELRSELSGQSVSHSKRASPSVIWVDAGDEVIVHRDSLKVRFGAGALVVSLDLECDQTGRQTITVPLALDETSPRRRPPGATGFFAVTDRDAHGPLPLVQRWGAIVQDVIWGGLVAIAQRRAHARGLEPLGIAVDQRRKTLQLLSGKAK
jgi:hypothetical protein